MVLFFSVLPLLCFILKVKNKKREGGGGGGGGGGAGNEARPSGTNSKHYRHII